MPFRNLPTLRLVAVCAALATAGLFLLAHRGEAQEETATLYVSGIVIGKRNTALVRLHNASPSVGDVFTVEYRVRHTDGGQTLYAVPAGAPLRPGQTLELDLGAIVNDFRAGQELPDFEGPVQFVAFGTGGVFRSFGPDSVVAEALQEQRRARFAPLVEWR